MEMTKSWLVSVLLPLSSPSPWRWKREVAVSFSKSCAITKRRRCMNKLHSENHQLHAVVDHRPDWHQPTSKKKRIKLLHEYVHSACMSANQTQDKSMDLLVACPLDMKAVSQLVLSIKCFFLCASSWFTKRKALLCWGNTCSATIDSASPANVWVSERIPQLHCHSPEVKRPLSTYVNW